MEALKEAHVRGLMLPDVPPYLPDAHQKPNPYLNIPNQAALMDAALHACGRIMSLVFLCLCNIKTSHLTSQAGELQEQKALVEAEMEARQDEAGEVNEVRCLRSPCYVFQKDK